MNNPILTVFLLTYNHEIYLDGESESLIEQCIKSIVEQECSYQFIVKILEDCSTDGTLAICQKYQAIYPDLIQIIAQKENTFSKNDPKFNHCKLAIDNEISTPYWCSVEGDDRYCYKHKLQEAIDFLEKNQSFVGYATQHLSVNNLTKHQHIVNADKPASVLSSDKYFYVHTATRVYRNIINFKEIYKKWPSYRYYSDSPLLALFVNEGYLFFDNKVTSVYNFTGKGFISSMNEKEKLLQIAKTITEIMDCFPKLEKEMQLRLSGINKKLADIELKELQANIPPKIKAKPIVSKQVVKKPLKWYIKHSIKMLMPPIIIKVANNMVCKK